MIKFLLETGRCVLFRTHTVVGILAGVLLLRETFQVQEIVGTAVILIGVIGVSFSYDKKDANGNRFNLDNAIRGSTKRVSSS